MIEIIKTSITVITSIYVGFITGLILDTDLFKKSDPVPSNNLIKSNGISNSIQVKIPKILNLPAPSRCDLDETKGCGGCVNG